MSKHNVTLSDRQRFDFWTFLMNVVQPKNREEARTLDRILSVFNLDEIAGTTERSPHLNRTSFSESEQITCVAETSDISQALAYLDLPGATALGALAILKISDALLDAKEKPFVKAPDEPGIGIG